MDTAKVISFSYVAGVRNGGVIEAPIPTEYRHALFQVIDFLAKIDLIYSAGDRSGASQKGQYYSFNDVGFYCQKLFKRISKSMNLPVELLLMGATWKRCGIFTGWRYLYT